MVSVHCFGTPSHTHTHPLPPLGRLCSLLLSKEAAVWRTFNPHKDCLVYQSPQPLVHQLWKREASRRGCLLASPPWSIRASNICLWWCSPARKLWTTPNKGPLQVKQTVLTMHYPPSPPRPGILPVKKILLWVWLHAVHLVETDPWLSETRAR